MRANKHYLNIIVRANKLHTSIILNLNTIVRVNKLYLIIDGKRASTPWKTHHPSQIAIILSAWGVSPITSQPTSSKNASQSLLAFWSKHTARTNHPLFLPHWNSMFFSYTENIFSVSRSTKKDPCILQATVPLSHNHSSFYPLPPNLWHMHERRVEPLAPSMWLYWPQTFQGANQKSEIFISKHSIFSHRIYSLHLLVVDSCLLYLWQNIDNTPFLVDSPLRCDLCPVLICFTAPQLLFAGSIPHSFDVTWHTTNPKTVM